MQPCGPRLEPSIQECDQRGISSSLSGDTKPIIIQSLSGLNQVLSVFQVCIKDKINIIFHVIISIVIIIVVIIIPIIIITTMVNNGWYLKVKQLIKKLLEEGTIAMYCDFHAHSRKVISTRNPVCDFHPIFFFFLRFLS